jgi:hypothetical protein
MRQEEGFWLLSSLLLSAGMADVIHNAVQMFPIPVNEEQASAQFLAYQ